MPSIFDLDALDAERKPNIFDLDALDSEPRYDPGMLGSYQQAGDKALGLFRAGQAAVSDALGVFRKPTDWLSRVSTRATGLDTSPETWKDERGLPHVPTAADIGESAVALNERNPSDVLDLLGIGQGLEQGTPERQVVRRLIESAPGVGAVAGLFDIGATRQEAEDAARRMGGEGLAKFAGGSIKVPVRLALGLGTDPLTATGLSAAGRALGASKATGPALSLADQAVAGAAAGLAGTGALEKGAESVSHATRGEWPEAGLALEDALLNAGLAYLGKRGASEIGARRRAQAPDTGLAYVRDRAASPEDIAAARAAEDAAGARSQDVDLAAMERAGYLLRGEKLDAPAPKVDLDLSPELTQAAERETDLAYSTMAPRGAAPDPAVYTALKARLLDLWQKEKRPIQAPNQLQGPAARLVEQDQGVGLRDRQFLRTMEPALEATARLPGVGKELAGRAREFEAEWEQGAGAWNAEAGRAAANLGDNAGPRFEAEQIGRALDGQVPLESLTPEARAAAEGVKATFDAVRAQALDAGVISPAEAARYEAGSYWPHSPTAEALKRLDPAAKANDLALREGITFEEALSKLREPGSQLVAGTRHGRLASAERVRTDALKPEEIRYDLGVVFDHIREMSRRVAEAKHLGKNGEYAQGLIGKLTQPADMKFAQTFIDRLRDVVPQGRAERVSSAVRSLQSASGLTLSPITQITTLANTAAETGLRAAAKGLADTFGRDTGVSWSKPIKRMKASFREASLEAQSTGALFSDTAGALTDYYTSAASLRRGGKTGKLAEGVSRIPWVRATGAVDNAQRVVAANTAKYILPEALTKAKAGDATALRQLERWGVDPKAEAVTPEMVAQVAKRISDRSQFRVGVSSLPLWASSPLGRVAFQFQSFGYQHARMLGWASGEAAKGNWKPAATLMAGGAAMGYTSSVLRNALKGYGFDVPEAVSVGDWEKIAKDAFGAVRGRKHFAPTSGRGALLAALEGLGAAGGVGIWQTVLERSTEGEPLNLAAGLAGPTGSDLVNLARTVPALTARLGAGQERAAALAKGDETGVAAAEKQMRDEDKRLGAAAGRLVAGVLPQFPFVSPNEIVREATRESPSERPGYVGRAVDVAKGAPAKELLPLEAVPGKERQLAKRLREAGESARAADERREGITRPPEPKPLEKRVSEAERRAVLAVAKQEITEAVRVQDQAALQAALQKAAAAGVVITPKQLVKLMGGVYPEPDDEEDQ